MHIEQREQQTATQLQQRVYPFLHPIRPHRSAFIVQRYILEQELEQLRAGEAAHPNGIVATTNNNNSGNGSNGANPNSNSPNLNSNQ